VDGRSGPAQADGHRLRNRLESDLLVDGDAAGELEKIAASSSSPHRRVTQARALLWAREGVANEEMHGAAG
jgi:hypothetical protein